VRTEIDEQVSPALSLSHRKRHDTTDIIRRTSLFFRKVPNKLGTRYVRGRHDIEEKRLDVVVKCFVV
jgi:hypothetical protein